MSSTTLPSSSGSDEPTVAVAGRLESRSAGWPRRPWRRGPRRRTPPRPGRPPPPRPVSHPDRSGSRSADRPRCDPSRCRSGGSWGPSSGRSGPGSTGRRWAARCVAVAAGASEPAPRSARGNARATRTISSRPAAERPRSSSSSLVEWTDPKWPGVPGVTSATRCSPSAPRWRSSSVHSGSPVSRCRRRASSRRSCRLGSGGLAGPRPRGSRPGATPSLTPPSYRRT